MLALCNQQILLQESNMALRKWAYVFLSPNFDPKQHRTEMKSDTCTYITIGIDMNEKEKVLDVAKQLVAEDVQLIELCGGFGPLWLARVNEAINGAVPIGVVMYGPESRKPMLDILTSK